MRAIIDGKTYDTDETLHREIWSLEDYCEGEDDPIFFKASLYVTSTEDFFIHYAGNSESPFAAGEIIKPVSREFAMTWALISSWDKGYLGSGLEEIFPRSEWEFSPVALPEDDMYHGSYVPDYTAPADYVD